VSATVTPRASAASAPAATASASPVEPAGFSSWWQALEVDASHGLPALEQAGREASGAHKQHVVTQHREAWTALKGLAQNGNGRAR
jgi:hypothetical protein